MTTEKLAIARAALQEIATYDPGRIDAATLGNLARSALARIDGEPRGLTWRTTPHGTHVLANAAGEDIGHVYRNHDYWIANAWGHVSRVFPAGRVCEARAYVESFF